MDRTDKNPWLTSVGSFFHKSSDTCSQGLCLSDLTEVTKPRLESVVRPAPCTQRDGAEPAGGRFSGGKWTSCCQQGEEWMPPSEQKQVAEPPQGEMPTDGPPAAARF